MTPSPHARPRTRTRTIVTPEGLPLAFEVAPAAERITAFLIDGLIIGGTATVVVLLAIILAIAMQLGGQDQLTTLMIALLVLGWFVLANLYFVIFELRWAGQTPGKRRTGLRVIARDGGPLTGEAVLARNLTRQIEIFLPLGVLLGPAGLTFGAPNWTAYVTGLWLVLIPLLPLFNRDHLRAGDLCGGTIVVRQPRAVLLEDVGAAPAAAAAGHGDAHAAYAFTDAQLATYGIYELHVLEGVLRETEQGTDELAETVAARIARRIGWDPAPPPAQARAFLQAFYRAQRGRLERGLLLGQRKHRKT